jgi:hypothetical protein
MTTSSRKGDDCEIVVNFRVPKIADYRGSPLERFRLLEL